MSPALPGWPGGDPAGVRRGADAWDELASTLRRIADDLQPVGRNTASWWSGSAADAYRTAWARFSSTLDTAGAPIRHIAGEMRVAASRIERAQHLYEAAVAGGAVLAVATLGAGLLVDAEVAAGAEAALLGMSEWLNVALASALRVAGSALLRLQVEALIRFGPMAVPLTAGLASGAATALSGDRNPEDVLLNMWAGFEAGGGTGGRRGVGTGSGDELDEAAPPGLFDSSLARPTVEDSGLNNLVSDLYHGEGSPRQIGTGSTADAVRNELRTGLPTEGTWHMQKAEQYVVALNRWVANHPDAAASDITAARLLLQDLTDALEGK